MLESIISILKPISPVDAPNGGQDIRFSWKSLFLTVKTQASSDETLLSYSDVYQILLSAPMLRAWRETCRLQKQLKHELSLIEL